MRRAISISSHFFQDFGQRTTYEQLIELIEQTDQNEQSLITRYF